MGAAEDLLKQGRLEDCLKALEGDVRQNPADAKRRVFLFQLLSVMGQWDRALNQVSVAADLDESNKLMAQVAEKAILCERFREDVYAGKRSPLILGEPEPWMGLLVQAAMYTARGEHAAAAELRAQAFEQAPAISGEIRIGRSDDDVQTHPIEWVADADETMGPMLEAIVDGKYYWVPWQRIALLRLEPPSDLRDSVWLPGQVVWSAGGTQVCLIPTRYPGSHLAKYDGGVRLARKTEFVDRGGWEGPIGQRLLATDAGEFGLLDTRGVRLGDAPLDPEAPGEGA